MNAGICIRSLLALAKPYGSSEQGKTYLQKVCVSSLQLAALGGDQSSRLLTVSRKGKAFKWFCPGRWQKFATFILGHVCPQSRWPAFATTSPVFQRRREGAPGLYFPVTTFQSCSARALYIYHQPWSGLRVPPNQLIFILPAYWILTSSYTSRECDSWVISW